MIRRDFLRNSVAGAGTVLTAAQARRVYGAGERIRLAAIGVNSRGRDLANSFSKLSDVEIAYVCDVDSRAVERVSEIVEKNSGKRPQGLVDFRKALDDPGLDGVIIGMPDHWHAPATILACAAGKHVYCEKPASHNPREGELMIAAARKHNRVVQLGTQRRSMPGVKEAIERLKGGAIGRVLWSRGWYTANRGSIGHGQTAEVPEWLDYSLWQGPAPTRPFRDNLLHYTWHWYWHWGTGEMGNNAIHALDVCRWGMGVDYPTRVSSGGQKLRWDDDQETPDSQVVTYDYDGCSITYEGKSWHTRGFEGSGFGISFHGEKGAMIIDGANYKIFDPDGKLLGQGGGSSSDAPHHRNFLDCIRSGARPVADIEDGHKSTYVYYRSRRRPMTPGAATLHQVRTR